MDARTILRIALLQKHCHLCQVHLCPTNTCPTASPQTETAEPTPAPEQVPVASIVLLASPDGNKRNMKQIMVLQLQGNHVLLLS